MRREFPEEQLEPASLEDYIRDCVVATVEPGATLTFVDFHDTFRWLLTTSERAVLTQAETEYSGCGFGSGCSATAARPTGSGSFVAAHGAPAGVHRRDTPSRLPPQQRLDNPSARQLDVDGGASGSRAWQ